MSEDHIYDECGVFGVYGNAEAARLVYLGLYALQHRGQEAAGIVSSDGVRQYRHHGMGLVGNVFDRPNLDRLEGHIAVGHVRYSTTGQSVSANCQPIAANYHGGSLALAHNGNLVNAFELRRELESNGAIFQTHMDTEILIHLIAQNRTKDLRDALLPSLKRMQGAYSMILMSEDVMIGIRDPHGLRPLVLGRVDGSWLLSSESCAFDILDGELIRELEPGEVIMINRDGLHSEKPFMTTKQHLCMFEYIYFSRPDSVVENQSVYENRKQLGRQLALERPIDGDVVIAVPDSSNVAALGYAQESGIPYEIGLIRSHYVGRTFIEPDQKIRHFGTKIKYNPVRYVLEGKRVIVVDDSIVRGTTSRKIVTMLRRAGAREIHFLSSSPPIKHSCFYGIDTPDPAELIAANMKPNEIAKAICADSVYYLSIEGLLKATGREANCCLACFSGEYKAGRPENFTKDIMEKARR